jgi:hypothetical protein
MRLTSDDKGGHLLMVPMASLVPLVTGHGSVERKEEKVSSRQVTCRLKKMKKHVTGQKFFIFFFLLLVLKMVMMPLLSLVNESNLSVGVVTSS